MARAERVDRIKAIEKLRGSRVLSIVLGDRPAVETRLAPDSVSVVARHLRTIGKQKQLDVFLYTVGGDIVSAFRLVGLLREYCERLAILVPFRCQSAGTLMALGADEICMVAEGQLSPVDPSTNGPYNPLLQGVAVAPGMPLPTIPVSVEEVVGFFSLAREIAKIEGEAGQVDVFQRLTNDVRPMALGQVFRARSQIRMLSKKLLQMHMDHDNAAIDAIVKSLTEELHSHDYLITRREAKSLGMKIMEPASDLDGAILALFQSYESDLKLREPFNPLGVLGAQAQVIENIDRAFIECSEAADAFRTNVSFAKVPGSMPPQLSQQNLGEGWRSV